MKVKILKKTKKKYKWTTILIILFLFINSFAFANKRYVATNGNDGNPGTITQPWKTWHYAFNNTPSGDTCYFRGGLYLPYSTSIGVELMDNSQDGTFSHPTCFFNYPGEVPTLECWTMTASNNYGIELSDCHHIYIKGLTVRNVRELADGDDAYGFRITSNAYTTGHAPNDIRIENCIVHNTGGMGFNTSGVDTVYFINCDSYTNCDSLSVYDGGGTGCGFQFYDATYANAATAQYIYLYHCRAWNSSDQGYSVVTPGLTIFDGCWSINNGNFHFALNTAAKGSGWKLWLYIEKERNQNITQIIIRNCIAVDNEYYGFSFTGEGPEIRAHLYNNFAYRNGKLHPQGWTGGYGIYDVVKSDTIGRYDHKYYNNISYNNYGYSGNYDRLEDVINQVTNKFDVRPTTISNIDFVSLDTTGLCGPRQADGSLPVTAFGSLASSSECVDGGTNVGLPYSGSAPDIGWVESSSVVPSTPVYVSSSVENATSSILKMNYDLSLANIIPTTSAFTVKVNSVTRAINSVSISGTSVLLTLSSPVIFGDVITVAYTKPVTNSLQTSSGGQAASITTKAVINNVSPIAPVYQNSSVQNTTPTTLQMNYNLTLANIIPAISAFTVKVNSVTRAINSISISGTGVLLTLSTPVIFGDVITVAYTKPATNPLQTPLSGQAATISPQIVTNNVSTAAPLYQNSSIQNATPTILQMNYNLTLANIIPATSAFTVMVNSVVRTVNSVSISGTIVSLTLSSPVVYGNIVSVAYTKPASNPLQTPSGGQAVTIIAQTVTNNTSTTIPVYQNSSVQNTTPTILQMNYNLTLANVIPATSAFSVKVNSTIRTVNSISISGTGVLLTLSTPVIFGDVVTVMYTKPSTNPLQTASGGQAATITTQAVTNNVSPIAPVYVSSSVQNATPTILQMIYNLTLANAIPATSAFTVKANSVTRTVNSVSISGTVVSLTLSSPVVYGNVVTIAYTKPVSNPLQTPSGGQASSLTTHSVTNNTISPTNISPTVKITRPIMGAKFRYPVNITIVASASDVDGTISKVEFYSGTTLLGSRSTSPFSYIWKNIKRGSYSITAVAIDNANARTTSSAISISVR